MPACESTSYVRIQSPRLDAHQQAGVWAGNLLCCVQMDDVTWHAWFFRPMLFRRQDMRLLIQNSFWPNLGQPISWRRALTAPSIRPVNSADIPVSGRATWLMMQDATLPARYLHAVRVTSYVGAGFLGGQGKNLEGAGRTRLALQRHVSFVLEDCAFLLHGKRFSHVRPEI